MSDIQVTPKVFVNYVDDFQWPLDTPEGEFTTRTIGEGIGLGVGLEIAKDLRTGYFNFRPFAEAIYSYVPHNIEAGWNKFIWDQEGTFTKGSNEGNNRIAQSNVGIDILFGNEELQGGITVAYGLLYNVTNNDVGANREYLILNPIFGYKVIIDNVSVALTGPLPFVDQVILQDNSPGDSIHLTMFSAAVGYTF
jgi:hypothetical protein